MKKSKMKKDNIIFQDVLEQLYLTRRKHKEARSAFKSKIEEVGPCVNKPDEICYSWVNGPDFPLCGSCAVLKPLHAEYVRRAYQAGHALARAVRVGKIINDDDD